MAGCSSIRPGRGLKALLAASLAASSVAPSGAERGEGSPLCHGQFLALETCLGSDYELLRAQCAEVYAKLQTCLDRDWRHIDAAETYERADASFNRMKRCRHGVMLYNPMDWYIGRGLEVYGEWGEKKVQIWSTIVKPGHVAVDVGAHIGALTLPLSKLVGEKGRVIAYEPFYPSFAALAANAGLNSLANVEVKQAVVADRTGKVLMNRGSLAFSQRDFFNFGSMSYESMRIYDVTDDVERPSSAEWDEYAVATLDQMSVSRLDFVKIDAEAMELAVVEGAQRLLRKFKPVLFVEYRNPSQKDTRLLSFLKNKMKYECVILRIPIFSDENFRQHSEDIWGGERKIMSFNLLCKHKWWEYPDMDPGILELFASAVDTDIEGLKTTATPDLFEIMAKAEARSPTPSVKKIAAPGASPSPGAKPPRRASSGAEPPVQQTAGKRYEDMTLDELLDDAAALPVQEERELSLDELLGQAPPGKRKAPPSASGDKAKAKSGKGEGGKPPPSKKARSPGAEESASNRERPEPVESRGARVEVLSLDELLGEADGKALSKAPPSSAQSTELSLDELLGPPSDEAPHAADLGAFELSLDELLAFEAPGAKKAPVAKVPSKAKDASAAKPGGKKPAVKKAPAVKTLAKPAATAAPAKVTYDQELSLDDL